MWYVIKTWWQLHLFHIFSLGFKILIAYEILCGYLGRHKSGAFSSNGTATQLKGPFMMVCTSGLTQTEGLADAHSHGFWRFLIGQFPALHPRELNPVTALDELAFIRVHGSGESVQCLSMSRSALTFTLRWCLHLRMSSSGSHYWKLLNSERPSSKIS